MNYDQKQDEHHAGFCDDWHATREIARYRYAIDDSDDSVHRYYWETLALIDDGTITGPTLSPSSIEDLPTATALDITLFHGALGSTLGVPYAKTDVAQGVRTFDLAFDRVTAGSYGVRQRGIVGESRWRLMHLRAGCGFRFAHLLNGPSRGPEIHVAIPPDGVARHRRGFIVGDFPLQAQSAGFDGYVTGDCCLVDTRDHLTVHLFPTAFARCWVTAVIEHHIQLLEVQGSRNRGPGLRNRLRDFVRPLPDGKDHILTDTRTIYWPRS